mmetsp:Transcript_22099/g.50538  ORF Transcript_22099/g.50538 Transcript_22099/m.50538 type:complete len:515 (-) Transcript_22099:12-1556(-)
MIKALRALLPASLLAAFAVFLLRRLGRNERKPKAAALEAGANGASKSRRPSEGGAVIPPPPRRAPPVVVKVWIALDFEWTCDDGLLREVRSDNVEIIEFAYVMLDTKAGKAKCEEQVYCKNERTPITAFCTQLTGISNETLKDAGSLADALQRFEKGLEELGVSPDQCCAVAHGSADLELVLPLHCAALGLKVPAALQRYVDLRLATQRHLDKNNVRGTGVRASSLKQICKALQVQQVGREHCGLDDAWMVLLSMQELIKRGADVQPIDFVAERKAFLSGRTAKRVLCLDGIPFFCHRQDLEEWVLDSIERAQRSAAVNSAGSSAGAGGAEKRASASVTLLIVSGLDGRPTGRVVVDLGSAEIAMKVLRAFPHGRLFVHGESEDSHAERLVLLRPLRREEWELPLLHMPFKEYSRLPEDQKRPALLPFPTDTDIEKLREPTRQVCFAFRKNGSCRHGDTCKYEHVEKEIDSRSCPLIAEDVQGECFAFKHGSCVRGQKCSSKHVTNGDANHAPR